MWRWRDDTHEIGGGEPFPDINDFDFDTFAGNHKGNEDDKIFETANTIAAEGNCCDVEFEPLTGLQCWW